MSRIKDWIFTYRAGKEPKREVIFPQFDNVRSVLVLFESDFTEKNPVIKSIAEQLRQEDKDVVL